MSRDPTSKTGRTAFWILSCIILTLIYSGVYQQGYDDGRARCRPAVKMDIQKMSVKAQARWVKYLVARQS